MIKRYNITNTGHTEHIEGEWVKYEDLDVVLSVIRERSKEINDHREFLRQQITQLRSEVETLKALDRNR